ncbi:MAG: DUF2911 domain-containing protein [Cytophagaceae bacterium]|nr:DUF2911 domain-containing protein [Cytophagaceae bacterium]
MFKTALTVLFVSTFALPTLAQRMAQPSPAALVKQTVGVTDITVTYSRPMLRGRTAFGPDSTSVRKYDQLWRMGANAATIIEFSTDAIVEGQALPAGKYSVFSLPSANEWTIIFNKTAGASEATYKQTEDALRVKVKPNLNAPKLDAFLFWFTNLSDSTATLNFGWDVAQVPIQLMVNTSGMVEKNVMEAVAAKPEDTNVLRNAADYNLSKGKNLDQALTWADKSIQLKETFRNVWTKAQILAKLGKFADAVPLAQKALQIGQGDPVFPFFKGGIESAMSDWKSKLPSVEDAKKMLPGKKKKKVQS